MSYSNTSGEMSFRKNKPRWDECSGLCVSCSSPGKSGILECHFSPTWHKNGICAYPAFFCTLVNVQLQKPGVICCISEQEECTGG